MKQIGKVYYIVNNNAPQPHTTIENPILKRNGYRLTHYSMGAHTAWASERYHHLAIMTVDFGCVHVEVHENGKVREIVLHKGEYWVRPRNVLCGWYVEEDTVFTVLTLRHTAHFIEGTVVDETYSLRDVGLPKDGMVEVKRTLDDALLKIDLILLGKGTRYVFDESLQGVFSIREGKCGVLYKNKAIKMDEMQSFILEKNGKTVIMSATGAKVIFMHFADYIGI